MDINSPRWHAITDSEFPWEREALAFVRAGLPDHEPYRVWSNFEFIADDGSINEVDLLVLTSKGFYLVEIKSRLIASGRTSSSLPTTGRSTRSTCSF